jgi:hypothetical protein
MYLPQANNVTTFGDEEVGLGIRRVSKQVSLDRNQITISPTEIYSSRQI